MAERLLAEPPNEGNGQLVANDLDDVDVTASPQWIVGIAGKRLSIREIIMSPAGQNVLRIEDDAGKVVLKRLNFDTAGGVISRNFVKGDLTGGVGQGLKFIGTQAGGATLIGNCYIIE